MFAFSLLSCQTKLYLISDWRGPWMWSSSRSPSCLISLCCMWMGCCCCCWLGLLLLCCSWGCNLLLCFVSLLLSQRVKWGPGNYFKTYLSSGVHHTLVSCPGSVQTTSGFCPKFLAKYAKWTVFPNVYFNVYLEWGERERKGHLHALSQLGARNTLVCWIMRVDRAELSLHITIILSFSQLPQHLHDGVTFPFYLSLILIL